MSSVVGIAVEGIIFATVGVTAINLIFAGNWTGVDATVQTIGKTVVSLMIAVAVMLLFLKRAGYKVNLS